MSILISGRIFDGLFLLIFLSILTYLIRIVETKNIQLKKKIPAIDGIEEAIGRAVEMGAGVHFCPGRTSMYGSRGTHVQMGYIILGHATKIASRLGAKIVASVGVPAQIAYAEELMRGAYRSEGDPTEPDVRFYADHDAGLAGGSLLSIKNDNLYINFIVGGMGSEFFILAETARELGAFQICGSANPWLIPFVVAASDYQFIGEDLFSAGAILPGNPVQIASVGTSDYSKLLLIALTILGSLFATIGNTAILDILRS